MNNVKMLIEVLTKIYSSTYNGKLDDVYCNKDAVIQYGDNSFTITSLNDNSYLPKVHVSDMIKLDEAIGNYVEAVKKSDTGYNIFVNPEFMKYNHEDNEKLVIETTLWNASVMDLDNLTSFFSKYAKFVSDETFSDIRKNKFIKELGDDKLYLMAKRNSLAFETPYYLDFMLAKNHYELPYVRLGIANNVAYIKTIQSNIETSSNNDINNYFKSIIPKGKNYRYFKPNHLIALVMTLGYLESKGINDLVIDDYLPIRLYHYIKERHLSEEEINNLQVRLSNEFINTFFKLASISEGIDITRFNADGTGIDIHFENVHFMNDELNNLYNIKKNNIFRR